jgi:hypothetical protein
MPHPPHVVGSAISRVAVRERRAIPIRVMLTSLPTTNRKWAVSQRLVDTGTAIEWAVDEATSM